MHANSHALALVVHVALRFERQLQSALRSTEHLGVPNAFRTAVCLDVLAKVSVKFERFQQILVTVRREAESAIYITTKSSAANNNNDMEPRTESARSPPSVGATPRLDVALARKTYFAELKQVLAEKEALERDLYVATHCTTASCMLCACVTLMRCYVRARV